MRPYLMYRTRMKTLRAFVLVLGLGAALVFSAACAPKAPPPPPPPVDLYGLLARSADTVTELSARYPRLAESLPQARGVVVFPRIADAALVFGGASGDGVVMVRGEDGAWSAPGFMRFTAVNAGLVVGATENSLVLLVANDETARRMAGMTLDISGAVRQISPDGTLKQHDASLKEALDDVVPFLGGKGFWAGLSMQAAYVSPEQNALRRFYGPEATMKAVLYEKLHPMPEQALALVEALGPAGPTDHDSLEGDPAP